MTLSDSFSLAFRTVKANRLRTGITVAIIAFGIMALIGIITAIQAMNQSIVESFSSMGANAFSIRYKEANIRMGNNRESSTVKKGQKEKNSNLNKYILKDDAEYFKRNFNFPARVSLSLRGPQNVECRFDNKKTNPVVTIFGGDENYIMVNGYSLDLGRNLNTLDVRSGRNVCLIGSNVAARLFPNRTETSIDKIIRIGNIPYRVIGLLKTKGSSSMSRADDAIITSYNNTRRLPNTATSYGIGIMVDNVALLEPATGEATATFRAVRKLLPTDADNFVIEKSDKFAEMFISFLGNITGAAAAIGMITLVGAAIGLMNIMLVAVSERTREVGLIKAIGGKKKNIRQQFLFESMIISLMGAAFGIILGIAVGNLFAMFLKTGFVIPWLWVFIGIAVCSLVGFLAGIYPALKASKLNPIVALRYE